MELDTFLERDIVEHLDLFVKEKKDYASEEEINSLLKIKKYHAEVLDALDNKEVSRPLRVYQKGLHLAKTANFFEDEKKKIEPKALPVSQPVPKPSSQTVVPSPEEEKKKEELKKQYPEIVLPQGAQYTYEYLKKYVLALLAIERRDRETAVKYLFDLYKHYPKNIAVQIRMQEALELDKQAKLHADSKHSFPTHGSTAVSSSSQKQLSHNPIDLKKYVSALQAIKDGNKETAVKLFNELKSIYPTNLAVKLHLQEATKI